MSILVDENIRLITQGITGKAGTFHTLACRDYGTNIVGGVTPGKGGIKCNGINVYNTVFEAVEKTDANASMIFVPAKFAKSAIFDAVEAGIRLIVCITEGIPVLDMVKIKSFVKEMGVTLIGPNCPGIISPGKCKIGIMPANIHKQGNIGIISRSGTLTYEAVSQLSELNLGQSTCIGIGGDPIIGMNFIDCLDLFAKDDQTQAVVLVGEIGGSAEEEAADWIQNNFDKPVVAYVAGVTAPEGRRMGHAGAIISQGEGTAESKFNAFEKAGVTICRSPAEIGICMNQILINKKGGKI